MRSCRGQRRTESGTKQILSLFPGPASGSGPGVGEGGARLSRDTCPGSSDAQHPSGAHRPGEICNEVFPSGLWGARLGLFLHTASQKGSSPAGWGAPLPSPCWRVYSGALLSEWVQRSCPTSARTRGWDPPLGVQADAPSAAPGSVASRLSRDVGPARG